MLARELLIASLTSATLVLEHNATLLPRPLVASDHLGVMALYAVNAVRRRQGAGVLTECPKWWLRRIDQACSLGNPAVLAFVAACDVHALTYCGSAREVHGVVLDRLAVHNFVGAPSIHARNRTQAMQALPWLLPLMMAHEGNRRWAGANAICRAIDDGAPLHGAVAQAFGVPREVVRWLGRHSLPEKWCFDVPRVRRLLTLLGWLPPERRPRNLAQFDALSVLGSALAAPFSYRGRNAEPVALARIDGCMRRWLDYATQGRTDHATAFEDFVHRTRELEDARDFLRALFEAGQAIDQLDENAADAWVLRWSSRIGLPGVLSLSQTWHEVIARAPDDDIDGPNVCWPAVLTGSWHGVDRMAVELISRDQLYIEGQRMAHCVGGYAAMCHSGNSVIVSLRTASGLPMSTAELHLTDHGVPAIMAVQHRAAHNTAPNGDCVRALGALLLQLNQGDQRLLMRRRAFQHNQRAGHTRAAGRSDAAQFSFSAAAQHAARRVATPSVAASATLISC